MARKKQKSAKGGAPISSHPAFPAIVALWFAALFGIGSLVLPTTMLESIISGIGVDKILPAAAPPLGFTARGIIALLVAGAGLVAGLFLARKVAQSQLPSKERSRDLQLNEADRHPDAPAKRPISAQQELGSEGLGSVEDPWKFEDEWSEGDDDDGYDYGELADDDDNAGHSAQAEGPAAAPVASSANFPGRRRALSVTDDSGPSDYLQTVPLPGQGYDDPLELDIIEEEPAENELAQEEFAEEVAMLRNEELAAPDTAALTDPSEAAPGFELLGDEPAAAADAATETDAAAMFAQPIDHHAPAVPASDNDFATSLVQEETMSQPNQAPQQDPQQASQQAPQQAAPSFAAPAPTQAAEPTDPSSAPGRNALSDLGMAELVERFATAMQAKAEREEEAASTPVIQRGAFDGANPFADRVNEADLDQLGETSGLPFTSPLSSQPLPSRSDEAVEVPAAAEAVAAEPAAAPMVFRRAGSAESAETPAPHTEAADIDASDPETPAAAPAFGQERTMPSALQPLAMFDDGDEDDDGTAHAPLSIDFARQRPFAGPVAREEHPAAEDTASDDNQEAAFAPPPSAQEPVAAEQDECEDAYSSLLSMKSKLSGQDFVRVDDEGDAEEDFPEPVVVFPGQHDDHQQEQPFGERNDGARMFDAPTHGAGGGNPVPQPTTPPSPPSDPTETERALREALEKLQRMSGAA